MLRFLGCSRGNVNVIPVSEKFEGFAIVTSQLDESCFKKVSDNFEKNIKKSSSNSFHIDDISSLNFNWKKIKSTNYTYEITKTISPLYRACGETCRFMNEDLIKIYDNYYFLSYPSDLGINAEMVSENIILFKAQMVTHTRNLILNIKHETLSMLPNGDIEFENNSILVKGQKSYLKGGGAFWYNSKRNNDGDLIEFVDVKSGVCIPKNKFYEQIEKLLNKAGKDELCVIR